MKIEEVKEFLGHEKLDTTLIYCTVKEENVQASHRKYAYGREHGFRRAKIGRLI